MVSTKYHQPSRVNIEVVIVVANIKRDLRKLVCGFTSGPGAPVICGVQSQSQRQNGSPSLMRERCFSISLVSTLEG